MVRGRKHSVGGDDSKAGGGKGEIRRRRRGGDGEVEEGRGSLILSPTPLPH